MKHLITILTTYLLVIFTIFSQDSLQLSLVKNINTNPLYLNYDHGSNPSRFVVSGGNIFFVAYDQIVGDELFISDGTDTGTHLLKNINTQLGNPFEEGSNPLFLTPYGDNIIFRAYDHDHNAEPWFSDGTEAGTFLLYDTDTIIGIDTFILSNPYNFFEYNSKIYFNASGGFGNELYVSDGTTSGTYMLKDIWASWIWSGNPLGFYVYNNLLYFSAKGSDYLGRELWVTDGTEPGTIMLKDLSIVPGGSGPGPFYEFQGLMYFAAVGDSVGRELWVSDGTEQGTILFADINLQNEEGSHPVYFTELNNLLYFWATDGVQGMELWFTDGVTVHLVKDINPTGSSFLYNGFHVYDGKLYFEVKLDEYVTPVLWVSDGTEAGTYQLNAFDSTVISEPKGFVNWNNQLVFLAHDYNSINHQIWVTDGTQENTRQMFSDSILGDGYVNPEDLILYNDEIYFGANYIDTIGNELYKISMGSSGNIEDSYSQILKLNAYPNPFTKYIKVDLSWNSNLKTIDIFNLNGKAVYSDLTKNEGLHLDLSFLDGGIYIIKVRDKGSTFYKKIVKQ